MINVWIALTADLATALKSAVAGEESPVPDAVIEAARNQIGQFDLTVTTSLFKVAVLDGVAWVAYTIYLDDETVDEWIATMSAVFPGRFRLLGGWNINEAAPVYPIDPDLLAWMPDVWDPETEATTPATVLTDVSVLAGQVPREFT